MSNLTIYTDHAHESDLKKFFGIYDLQKILVAPKEKQRYEVPSKDRVCRFCHRKYPYVTFRSLAHIIPESLGNRYLVSEIECDDCNHIFGRLDDQLINFIGVTRSLNGTRGKKETGKPNYPSHDKRVKVTHERFLNDPNAIRIDLAEAGNGAYNADLASNTQTFTFTKTPYVPLKVYLSLLKMAICIMPDNEMVNYTRLLDLINTAKKKDIKYDVSGAIASICLFNLDFGNDMPYLMLFKKRDEKAEIPTHVLRLAARNFSIEVKIPLHKDDAFVNSGKEIELMDCPPLFFSPYEESDTPAYKFFRKDLSSSEKVVDDLEQVTFTFTEKWLENLVKIDLDTGKMEKEAFDVSEIKGLWISNASISVRPDDESVNTSQRSGEIDGAENCEETN